jgi:hydroxyacylglutathione hydrolase
MQVRVLASNRTDNWFYLLRCGDSALLVDPIDADVAVAAVEEAGVRDVRVVNTHWHWDHVDGNAEVSRRLGCAVWAPAESESWGLAADVRFAPGDTLVCGDEPLRVLAAPGHTLDHVILATDEHWVLGDVVFVGGIGHCRLGGDVATAFRTISEVISTCPDGVQWYPGHDYSSANAAFGLSVLPDDSAIQRLASSAAGRSRSDGPLLFTMGQERAHNVFLRTDEVVVQAAAAAAAERAGLVLEALKPEVSPSELAFFQLRALRDRFT